MLLLLLFLLCSSPRFVCLFVHLLCLFFVFTGVVGDVFEGCICKVLNTGSRWGCVKHIRRLRCWCVVVSRCVGE
jgi:hypothetical protein